jgi:hypothetical protein
MYLGINMTAYEILLKGHLDKRWETIFTGFTIQHSLSPDGTPITNLTGPVRDQAALYGIVGRLRDIGVSMISFRPLDPENRNRLSIYEE